MSRRTVLPLAFFSRPAAKVARDLVGITLARKYGSEVQRYSINETEAYEGVHDLASHSSKGRTARTEVMFGAAGRFYIYRIYGLHWMLNVVTGGVGDGAAVLIRGVRGISGPGRLASALQIDQTFTGQAARRSTHLWFETADLEAPLKVVKTARIGVDYAGPIWAPKKLRFVAADAFDVRSQQAE